MGLTFYILMSLLLSCPTLTEEDLGIKDGIDDESLSCRHHSVGIVCLKGLEIMWGGYQLGWAGLWAGRGWRSLQPGLGWAAAAASLCPVSSVLCPLH